MVDFTLDKNQDLDIRKGDFVLADATVQNQHIIIVAQKGEFKEHPEICVGIDNALKSEHPQKVLLTIKRNLTYDGQKVENVELQKDGKIIVTANY